MTVIISLASPAARRKTKLALRPQEVMRLLIEEGREMNKRELRTTLRLSAFLVALIGFWFVAQYYLDRPVPRDVPNIEVPAWYASR
jgi:hypothetical protein